MCARIANTVFLPTLIVALAFLWLLQSHLQIGAEDNFGDVSGIGGPNFEDISMMGGDITLDADKDPANATAELDNTHMDGMTMDGNDTTMLDQSAAPGDMSFGKDGSNAQEIGFGEIETLAPEADTSTAHREKAKTRKRRMVIDVNLEIPSAEMRRGLEPHGPDDISRRPYRKKRGTFDFDRLPLTAKVHDYYLQDNSAEAMFTRSNIPKLHPHLEHMFTRYMNTKPRPELQQQDEMQKEVEFEQEAEPNKEPLSDIEVGRREPVNLDESGMPNAADIDDMHQQQANASLADPSMIFEPEELPDDSVMLGNQTMDATNATAFTMNETNGGVEGMLTASLPCLRCVGFALLLCTPPYTRCILYLAWLTSRRSRT